MKILGVIPARYASTRFPGKPLVIIDGMSMIQRVFVKAKQATTLSNVYVATDDERIFNHVKDFGGDAVMTSPDHQSGTDRCMEVSSLLDETYDIVINIQGDEPFIDALEIDKVARCFESPQSPNPQSPTLNPQSPIQIATLAKKISNIADIFNKNTIKVVLNKDSEALYFSRSPIPFTRNFEENNWLNHTTYYKHIGIYAYRTDILAQITKLGQSSLEKAEALEQLRWLENGYKIKVAITEMDSFSIDTPEDLLKINPAV
jgi:3-deoxy-manno-octulosonate cytidylyltransferase (CMP-KDO synthetase)